MMEQPARRRGRTKEELAGGAPRTKDKTTEEG
jgi:hypothetical protein